MKYVLQAWVCLLMGSLRINAPLCSRRFCAAGVEFSERDVPSTTWYRDLAYEMQTCSRAQATEGISQALHHSWAQDGTHKRGRELAAGCVLVDGGQDEQGRQNKPKGLLIGIAHSRSGKATEMAKSYNEILKDTAKVGHKVGLDVTKCAWSSFAGPSGGGVQSDHAVTEDAVAGQLGNFALAEMRQKDPTGFGQLSIEEQQRQSTMNRTYCSQHKVSNMMDVTLDGLSRLRLSHASGVCVRARTHTHTHLKRERARALFIILSINL
jgi:hypothetical protein